MDSHRIIEYFFATISHTPYTLAPISIFHTPHFRYLSACLFTRLCCPNMPEFGNSASLPVKLSITKLVYPPGLVSAAGRNKYSVVQSKMYENEMTQTASDMR